MGREKHVIFGFLLTSCCLLVVGSALTLSVKAEGDSAQVGAWTQLKSLAGDWVGTGQTPGGKSRVAQSIQLIHDGNFVHINTKSVVEAKDKAASVHTDWEILSFDRARDRVVLRQFVSEGFVNRFVLERIGGNGTFDFVLEDAENLPKGFQAEQSYRIDPDGNLSTELKLAPPGAALSTCVRTTLRRP